ncbi:MAG: hypothetical protein ABFE01_26480 [Phycisphaerales bacterium]
MDIEEAVGAELRACRQKKNVSQEQLGFDADRTVTRNEPGAHRIT